MERAEKERRFLLSTLVLDDSLWDIKNVLGHRVNKYDPKYEFIELKVMFKNPTQEVKSVSLNILIAEDPDPILKYIHRKHLHNQDEFK